MKKGVAVSVIAVLIVVSIVLGVLYVTNNTEKTRTIETLNATISEKERLIEALNTDITSKETMITDLNTDIAYKSGQIETLKEDVSKKEAQIEELKKREAENTEQINVLNAAIEKLNTDIADLKSELKESEKQVAATQKEIQDANETISELNAKISAKDVIIKNLEDKLAAKDEAATPTEKQYAGATPVPVYPLERPTATPLPELEFSYRTYDATTNLGVSFDAPIGWEVTYGTDYYKLTNTDLSMDYQAFVLLEKEKSNQNYTNYELTDKLKSKIESIGESISSFSPSNTAERTFMGKVGVYANYIGITDNGAEVGGRIIVTQVNEAVYYLHVSYPKAYGDTYVQKVYDKIRHTIRVQ